MKTVWVPFLSQNLSHSLCPGPSPWPSANLQDSISVWSLKFVMCWRFRPNGLGALMSRIHQLWILHNCPLFTRCRLNFSWRVAEHSKKLPTRNYPIFPWELLPGEGRSRAADTGTYSLISLQGYKLVPFSQQGAHFSEPSFVFQIRYTNKLIAIFKNTKQESPIMRAPWASEFLPHWGNGFEMPERKQGGQLSCLF